MGRQRVSVQANQFIGGLNTEANPLDSPINVTVDEKNFELISDGSRSRRLGIGNLHDPLEVYPPSGDMVNGSTPYGRTLGSMYIWKTRSKELLVIGHYYSMSVHDLTLLPADTLLYTTTLGTVGERRPSFTTVNEELVLASGERTVRVFTYNGTAVSTRTVNLLIRDFIGVPTTISSVDLRSPLNVQVRPATITAQHRYNLHNQGFGREITSGNSNVTTKIDPIAAFYAASGSTVYPSNADYPGAFVGPNAFFESNRTIDRYRASDNFNTTPTQTPSPTGYFIIGMNDPDAQRNIARAANIVRNPLLASTALDVDSIVDGDGPRVVESFGGRVWYSGWTSSEETNLVLFSQVAPTTEKINLCYQEADPTSPIDPDIVATDGGSIVLDGAIRINAMIPMQSSLFVFSESGVWEIRGASDSGFTAEAYSVKKLSDKGCISGNSAVLFEQTIIYWGEDAMYAVVQNEVGSYVVQNISRDLIQTLYQECTREEKESSYGFYDELTNSYRWVFNDPSSARPARELVLNTKYNSFTLNSIEKQGEQRGILMGISGAAFDLTHNLYFSLRVTSTPASTYTLVSYTEESYYDYEGFLDPASITGIDSGAFMTTGFVTGGDARLRKEIPRITTYLNQLDETLTREGSSCFLSSRWDWTEGVGSSRWSTPRQAYRPQRLGEDYGVVVTKNRIRGSGHSVALHFEAEAGKPCHIYGWEHNLESGVEE